MPFTSSLLVNEQECLRLLDQMRTAIPEEIRQARRALAERDRLIAQAQEESYRIISSAREQALNSIDSKEIMREAENRAAAMLAKAEQDAKTLERGAQEYALEVLLRMAEDLQRSLAQIQKGIKHLQEETRQAEPREQVPGQKRAVSEVTQQGVEVEEEAKD